MYYIKFENVLNMDRKVYKRFSSFDEIYNILMDFLNLDTKKDLIQYIVYMNESQNTEIEETVVKRYIGYLIESFKCNNREKIHIHVFRDNFDVNIPKFEAFRVSLLRLEEYIDELL